MLSREAFDRYSRQVGNLADGADEYVRRMVYAYLSQHPDASVAECRDFAWQVMLEAVQIYGDASATAAADYYDSVMSAAGTGAKPALLHSGVDEDQAEKVARYQAGKLVKGDQLGFARECAAYASDATRQAANRTMLGNALRDEGRGVRYARVPTGAETCTFCRMLSSRGFVYRSKESAKLFGHNHRGCNCEIAVSTDAEGLEGYDPDREFDIWRRYEEIDADTSLTREENEAAKRTVLNLVAAKSNPSTGYRAGNLDLSDLAPGELTRMQRKNPLEWESYVQLSRLGYEQKLLHEQGNASANIDISLHLDGEWHYWDMKTIEGGTHALKKRMTECYSKWVRLSEDGAKLPSGISGELLDSPRAVVDNRFSKMTDEDARSQISSSMTYLSAKGPFRFAQTILILKDGSTEVIA